MKQQAMDKNDILFGDSFALVRAGLIILVLLMNSLLSFGQNSVPVPEHFKKVDQLLWVVSDLDNVMSNWRRIGFDQTIDLDTVDVISKTTGITSKIKLTKANLGGAQVSWIQPLDNNSIFAKFLQDYGEGGLSIVHRLPGEADLSSEINRMKELGINLLEEIEFKTRLGDLSYVLMDTRVKGKYCLGYTYSEADLEIQKSLLSENSMGMKLNQYAFAIKDAEPVSVYWNKLGQPEFEINYPEPGNTHYYGDIVDHKLIQGWQRHGTVAYEWCVPVKSPIVYEDHINKYGEGIHHLAYTVSDMDKAVNEFLLMDYVVSMGGTWGEEGKPGSGRYEYIDLGFAGGITLELLWNYHE